MGYASSKFPVQVWDGLSRNPLRISREVDQWCNQDDWDQLVAEIQATQEQILSTPSVDGVERISLFAAEVDEDIVSGQFIRIRADGKAVLASSNVGVVSGITLATALEGQTIIYLRRGRLNSTDWTVTTGGTLLSPGEDYFLSLNGTMSLTAPETGYLVNLGQAQSTTEFDLNAFQTIRL